MNRVAGRAEPRSWSPPWLSPELRGKGFCCAPDQWQRM
jgi:hypothetical protein